MNFLAKSLLLSSALTHPFLFYNDIDSHFIIHLSGLVTIENEAEPPPPWEIHVKFLKPLTSVSVNIDSIQYFRFSILIIFDIELHSNIFAGIFWCPRHAAPNPAALLFPSFIRRYQTHKHAISGLCIFRKLSHNLFILTIRGNIAFISAFRWICSSKRCTGQ